VLISSTWAQREDLLDIRLITDWKDGTSKTSAG
jgi:hypothetical protein